MHSSPARQVRVNRINETYVLFAGEGVKFEESTDICHNQFGGSAIVRDRNDQEFLKAWLKEQMQTDESRGEHKRSLKTWLGARYFRESGGRLVWQTLQQKSRQAFAFWAKNEPKCFSSCCGVAIDADGAWSTIPCDWEAQVLCKMSKSDSERYLQSLRDAQTIQSTTGSMDSESLEGVSPPETVASLSESQEGSEENNGPEDVNDGMTAMPRHMTHMTRMQVQLGEMEEKLNILWQNVTHVTNLLEEEREARRKEMANMKATMGRLQADFESSLKSLEKMIRTRLP